MDGFIDQIIKAYMPYFTDTEIAFAILTTWAIVAFLKKFIVVKDPIKRDRYIVIFASLTGFAMVLLFKIHHEYSWQVIETAFIVGMINPYLYRFSKFLLFKYFPGLNG